MMIYYKDFKYLKNIIKNKKYTTWFNDKTNYNITYWNVKYDNINKFYSHYNIITNLNGNITGVGVEYKTFKYE